MAPRYKCAWSSAPSAASQQSSTITSSPIACICARWSSLGCQGRGRGCCSGKRARDRRVSIIVNNNIASRSADCSSQLIPVVTTLRRTSVTEPLQFNSTVDIVNIVQQYVVSCIAMHTAVILSTSSATASAASQQSSTITSSPIACICARWSRRGTTLSTVCN